MPFLRMRASVVPPGGWTFPTPHGVIVGLSVEDLVAKVTSYRRANLLPLGDVEQDIEAHVCAKWPDQCHGSEGTMPSKADAARASGAGNLGARVAMWLVAAMQDGSAADHVDAETTLGRAAICRECVAMKPATLGCCGLSEADATRLVTLLRKGKTSTADLGGCEVMGFYCSVAVLLKRERLPSATGQLAPNCWMKP